MRAVLAKANPTLYYWNQIWTKHFPTLYTEQDYPQCVECASYDEKILECYQEPKNPAGVAILQEKKGSKLFFSEYQRSTGSMQNL